MKSLSLHAMVVISITASVIPAFAGLSARNDPATSDPGRSTTRVERMAPSPSGAALDGNRMISSVPISFLVSARINLSHTNQTQRP